uniref:Sodium:proton antiporter n=1 Tax=Neobacillus citreus TaxID=2833578 RepID=A0A942Y9B7_9BACI
MSETERGRNETPTERWDRNWADIQQELRIVQTGTQILAGFLLTLPFQQRFEMLSDGEEAIYLVLVALAVTVTVVALSAVSSHRLVFRQRQKHDLVRAGNVILLATLGASALLFSGTVLFVFDVVIGDLGGILSGIAVFVLTALLWVSIPLALRRTRRDG